MIDFGGRRGMLASMKRGLMLVWCMLGLGCGSGSAPQIVTIAPPEPNVLETNQQTKTVVNLGVTDPDGDLAELIVELIDPAEQRGQTTVDIRAQAGSANNASVGLVLTLVPQAVGVYRIVVRAADEAGNQSAPMETTLTAQEPPPPQ